MQPSLLSLAQHCVISGLDQMISCAKIGRISPAMTFLLPDASQKPSSAGEDPAHLAWCSEMAESSPAMTINFGHDTLQLRPASPSPAGERRKASLIIRLVPRAKDSAEQYTDQQPQDADKKRGQQQVLGDEFRKPFQPGLSPRNSRKSRSVNRRTAPA